MFPYGFLEHEEKKWGLLELPLHEMKKSLDIMERVYLDSRQDNAIVENAASDIIMQRSLGREIET